MLTCSLLTCAMMLLQDARDREGTLEQLRPPSGSDDVTWVRGSEKKAAMHIRGPFWTRGLAVQRTKAVSVWIVPGPSGFGSTAGLGMTVDF
jgi:hypothetical protein